jgi:predicted permease
LSRATRIRFWFWLIQIIGVIVPRRLRLDWRQEWEAELRHRELLLADWDNLNWRTKLDLLQRSLGAFWDALLLQPARLEDEMFQDLRYGVRMLLKSKAFTIVAALSLGLGIGANTALFSVVDAVMLKSLPVRAPEQLVLLRWLGGEGVVRGFRGSTEKDSATGLDTSTSISYPAFERFRDQSQTLDTVFSFAALGQVTVNIDGVAEAASVQSVSGNYFDGLGVSPFVGRMFSNEDEKAGAEPAAVISHRYWQRRFDGDLATIGKVIHVGSSAYTIVGVTPPAFFGTLDVGSAPSITVPMGMHSQLSTTYAQYQRSGTNWWIHIMGRLKQGVSVDQAQTELTAILHRHIQELPTTPGVQMIAPQIRLESGQQGLTEMRRSFSDEFEILMVIVGLVLLIACVNLANLQLARSAARIKELAVRVSVGASRLRLIRQLLTESALLAVLGGGLGLLFAAWAKDALLALLTANWNERAIDASLDLRVLGFTAVTSILTGILFGLAPALRATRIELTPMLKENPGSSGSSRSRLSKALVVTQVALSLVLLAGAGLFVRTLRNLNQIDAGFNRDNLLMFRVATRYEASQRANLYQQITERIAALPGVRAVSSSLYPLLAGSYSSKAVTLPGTTAVDEPQKVRVAWVAPGFLAAMEIPLLLGREFVTQDNQQAPNVVVVNQAFVHSFFADQSPLGQRLKADERELQIVGVARDAKYGGIREAIVPVIYLPYLQNRPALPAEINFAVRTVGDPVAATPAIRQVVQEIEPSLPMFDVRTQSDVIARSFAQQRLFAMLSSFFGLLSLALVSIGLFGVMSYTVARRTHEIGIRMALGAQPRDMLTLIIRQGMTLVLGGVAIGLAGALALSRSIDSWLYNVSVTDPTTFAAISLLLVSVAFVGCYLPAYRAAKVDPLTALRHE